jgi:putative peptide zinc metalloprotease protein
MGQPLLVMDHPELRAERIRLTLDREALRLKRDIAVVDEPAVARALEDSLEAIEAQVADLERRLSLLEVRAPVRGVWLSPGIDHAEGSYVKRGQSLGMVASASEVLVRAVAGQAIGPRVATGKARERAREAHELFDEAVELRVRGRPDLFSPGRIEQALPAGLDELPSAALGYLGGGTTRVDAQDSSGRRAAEPVFELRIAVSPPAGAAPLLSGQRVVVRLSSEPKPIAAQAWRALRQLLQERLQW